MKRFTSSLMSSSSSSCPESSRTTTKDKLTGVIQKKESFLAKKKTVIEDKRASRLKSTKSVTSYYEDPQNPSTATSGKDITVVMPAKKRRAFEDMGNKNMATTMDIKRPKKTWLSVVKSNKTELKGVKDKENVVKVKQPTAKKHVESKVSESKPSSGKVMTKTKKKVAIGQAITIPVPSPLDKQRRDSNWDLENLRKAIDNLVSEPPEGVINIDEQCTDYFFCPEYAKDIIAYLKDKEQHYKIGREFLADDPEVNPNMRSILIDWLIQVQTHLNMSQETLHMTVAMLDLFLQEKRTPLNKLQLLGITCLLIASKFEERYAPPINKLIRLTDNTYKYHQVIQNELLVLKTLKCFVNPPIAVTFLERYLVCLPVSKTLEFLSRYIIDLAIHDFQCVEFLPSKRAAAAVYLARRILKKCSVEEIWTGELCYYSGYIEEDLLTCVQRFARLLLKAEKSKFQLSFCQFKFSGLTTTAPECSGHTCVQRFARLLLKAEKSKFQGARDKYNSYGNFKSVSSMPSLCSTVVQNVAKGVFQ